MCRECKERQASKDGGWGRGEVHGLEADPLVGIFRREITLFVQTVGGILGGFMALSAVVGGPMIP